MTALELLRDTLARVSALVVELDYGDVGTAGAIAADLEQDLAAALAQLEERAP
jgi:hypothetical protein